MTDTNDNIIDAICRAVLDQTGKHEIIGNVLADHGRVKAKAILARAFNARVQISRSDFTDCPANSLLFRVRGNYILVSPEC